jgi:hypothetical protein
MSTTTNAHHGRNRTETSSEASPKRRSRNEAEYTPNNMSKSSHRSRQIRLQQPLPTHLQQPPQMHSQQSSSLPAPLQVLNSSSRSGSNSSNVQIVNISNCDSSSPHLQQPLPTHLQQPLQMCLNKELLEAITTSEMCLHKEWETMTTSEIVTLIEFARRGMKEIEKDKLLQRPQGILSSNRSSSSNDNPSLISSGIDTPGISAICQLYPSYHLNYSPYEELNEEQEE